MQKVLEKSHFNHHFSQQKNRERHYRELGSLFKEVTLLNSRVEYSKRSLVEVFKALFSWASMTTSVHMSASSW